MLALDHLALNAKGVVQDLALCQFLLHNLVFLERKKYQSIEKDLFISTVNFLLINRTVYMIITSHKKETFALNIHSDIIIV